MHRAYGIQKGVDAKANTFIWGSMAWIGMHYREGVKGHKKPAKNKLNEAFY